MGRGFYLVDQGFPFLMMENFNCIDGPQKKRSGRPFSCSI